MLARLNPQNEKLWLYLIAGIVLIIVVFVRLRLLGVALERDEGGVAYMAQQALKGVLPYTETYSIKPPGIYIVFAIILAIFGQSHTGIHLALLLTNIASAFLLFQLAGRLFNKRVGIAAGASFLVMTLSPSVQGLWANAEHFVILFALGGLLLAVGALEKESKAQLFLSGILLGTAILIKQHGVFFFLFGFIYICLFYFKKGPKVFKDNFLKVGNFVMGGLTPLALTAIVYLAANSFDAFWFWNYEYPYEYKYKSGVPLSQGMDLFVERIAEILKPNFLILLLSFLGIASIAWDKNIKPNYAFSFGFLIFSFLAITPGLYFRPHYFILWIPALSLFAGMGFSGMLSGISTHWLKTAAALCILGISFGVSFYKQKEFLFKFSTIEAARYVYGSNPFPESLIVADYINKNTDEEDEVAILGSEPQIFFYSRRKSASNFIWMYPLMGKHTYARPMQEKMVKKIESRQPKFIIYVNIPFSWLMKHNSITILQDWLPGYLKERYKISGIVDIRSYNQTIYALGDNAVKTYSGPKNNPYLNIGSMGKLFIFKKKDMSLNEQMGIDEAIPQFRAAIKPGPYDANSHNHLGVALIGKGEV